MDTFQLGEVIAEREFNVHDNAGEVKSAVFRIGKPQRQSSHSWYCPVQIIGLGDEKVDTGVGIDSLAALLSALYIAPALIQSIATVEQKRITFLEQDNLGFSLSYTRKSSK